MVAAYLIFLRAVSSPALALKLFWTKRDPGSMPHMGTPSQMRFVIKEKCTYKYSVGNNIRENTWSIFCNFLYCLTQVLYMYVNPHTCYRGDSYVQVIVARPRLDCMAMCGYHVVLLGHVTILSSKV